MWSCICFERNAFCTRKWIVCSKALMLLLLHLQSARARCIFDWPHSIVWWQTGIHHTKSADVNEAATSTIFRSVSLGAKVLRHARSNNIVRTPHERQAVDAQRSWGTNRQHLDHTDDGGTRSWCLCVRKENVNRCCVRALSISVFHLNTHIHLSTDWHSHINSHYQATIHAWLCAHVCLCAFHTCSDAHVVLVAFRIIIRLTFAGRWTRRRRRRPNWAGEYTHINPNILYILYMDEHLVR